MLTALMVAMVVSCRPYQPVPPPPRPENVTFHCENGDQVRRGTWGQELSRVSRAPGCPQPAPVRLTTQPGWKFGLAQRG